MMMILMITMMMMMLIIQSLPNFLWSLHNPILSFAVCSLSTSLPSCDNLTDLSLCLVSGEVRFYNTSTSGNSKSWHPCVSVLYYVNPLLQYSLYKDKVIDKDTTWQTRLSVWCQVRSAFTILQLTGDNKDKVKNLVQDKDKDQVKDKRKIHKVTDLCLCLVSGEILFYNTSTHRKRQMLSHLCLVGIRWNIFKTIFLISLIWSFRVARLSLVVLFAQDAMEEVVKVKGDLPRWDFDHILTIFGALS